MIDRDFTQFKPCPFCGQPPDVTFAGTCIDVECCCSMHLQKSDELTIEQRKTWNDKTYMYGDEAEQIAWDVMLKEWNTREGDNNAST